MEQAPKGVIFDFGNVIARIDNAFFIARLTGKPREFCSLLMRRVFFETSLSRDFETGSIGLADFQRGVEDILRVNVSPEAFAQAYCEMFQPVPETVELLTWLKGRCRLGLLSNTNPLHFEQVFRRLPVFPLFDQLTLSYEVGAMKPSPEIFQDAIRKAGCLPADLLYLDDLLPFVLAARKCGMEAWHFDDPAAISQRVRSLF